jgi:hypothetical protein
LRWLVSALQDTEAVKRRLAILIALGLALALGALTIWRLSATPGVSMSLVEYKRWPHGAMVRLTNASETAVRYFAQHDETPAGGPILCLRKTPTGWTNASGTLKTIMGMDIKTKKIIELFYLTDHMSSPGYGTRLDVPWSRELKPGKSVEFFIRLEPGESPRRMGTVCHRPPSKLASKLHPWIFGAKKWLGFKTAVPGQFEVWCPQELFIASPQDSPR